MSKSKHSEVQIIGALKQVEAGRSVEDVARDQGVGLPLCRRFGAIPGCSEITCFPNAKPLLAKGLCLPQNRH
jgi:hypothetical protein